MLKEISGYQAEISQNPYNYSAHLSLVTLLRKTEYFDKLREARKSFSEFYPLTPQLWVEWVNDEQKIASSEEEKKVITDLFVKGVEDYVSVDLWLEYCQFSIGGIGTEEGVSSAREVFEKALTSCGRNIAKGCHIWDAYRELETVLLSMLPAEGSADQLEAHSDQRKKVENIFRRQLRIPLQGMSTTMKEYKEFVGGEVDSNLLSEFNKANKKLKDRQVYEDKLPGEDNEEVYREYLEFELKEKDPVMIQQLYERAITDNCLKESLWLDYLNYLEESLKIPDVSLRVYRRAIRNVPWCLTLWCDYLRAMERYHQPPREIRELFEQALSAGLSGQGSYLELWLCFIDYKRRGTVWETDVTESMSELRNVFEKANTHLAKCGDDPEFEVSKYWANLEADQFGMMGNARKIWSEITAADPSRAAVWLDYIQLEKTFGDKKHLRRAYQRAVEKTLDTPEIIVKSFIQFEREEGSLEAYEEAKKLCKVKMDKTLAAREKEASAKMEEEKRNEEKIERKKEKDKQQRRERRQQASAEKRGSASIPESAGETFLKPKVPVPVSKAVLPPPGFPGAKKVVAPPPGFNENKKRTVDPDPALTQPDSKRVKTEDYESQSEDEQKKMRTVFVSNLDFSLTEDHLRQCLETSGPILDVRLVKKATGESKGFAFIEFEKFEDAQAALKRDNEPLEGRPMYVSVCDAERRTPAFKYDTGLEKNKLYVSSLDPSVTRQELQEIFGKFGKLLEVRIPTYRNGHTKGIAFVDFEDEVSAATALVKADNLKIKSKNIRVALSNPPKRKTEGGGESGSDVKSLGGTESKDFGPRGKGRSQLAFTPRSISVPNKPAKLEPMKFVKPKDPGAGTNGSEVTNGAGKSNAQFRQLLNKP